jgi:hypothetical protein
VTKELVPFIYSYTIKEPPQYLEPFIKTNLADTIGNNIQHTVDIDFGSTTRYSTLTRNKPNDPS